MLEISRPQVSWKERTIVILILYSFDHLLTGFNPDEVVVHQPQRPAVDPDNDLAAAAEGDSRCRRAGANLLLEVSAL